MIDDIKLDMKRKDPKIASIKFCTLALPTRAISPRHFLLPRVPKRQIILPIDVTVLIDGCLPSAFFLLVTRLPSIITTAKEPSSNYQPS
jgi:hypothetical protein